MKPGAHPRAVLRGLANAARKAHAARKYRKRDQFCKAHDDLFMRMWKRDAYPS